MADACALHASACRLEECIAKLGPPDQELQTRAILVSASLQTARAYSRTSDSYSLIAQMLSRRGERGRDYPVLLYRRLINACTWFKLKIGDPVSVTTARLSRHAESSATYGPEVLYGVGERYNLNLRPRPAIVGPPHPYIHATSD
ncbi:MAG: hypothetical protein AMXMBFR59_05960 [Rhodanobacteraceae bacterium]